ncbi:MAG: ribonuclease [Verrucomicrobiota bacterium]
MELRACIRAFEYVRTEGYDLRVQRVQIVTDSRYVHDHLYQADKWRRDGWRNTDGRPIENRDLWKELIAIRGKVRVRTDLEQMKGKRSPILKAADKSAKKASSLPWSVDRGFKGGKVARSKTIGKRSAASMFGATGQEAIIRIYRSGLLGRIDHKIHFDVFSEQAGEFVHKAFAYASPQVAVELHRHHCYRVCFNNKPRHPIIERIVEELPH